MTHGLRTGLDNSSQVFLKACILSDSRFCQVDNHGSPLHLPSSSTPDLRIPTPRIHKYIILCLKGDFVGEDTEWGDGRGSSEWVLETHWDSRDGEEEDEESEKSQ